MVKRLIHCEPGAARATVSRDETHGNAHGMIYNVTNDIIDEKTGVR
jgi:hypothetical protein